MKGIASADQDAISQVTKFLKFYGLRVVQNAYKKSCFSCQSEYQRGVSAWNFNVEDLKEQASLVSSTLWWLYDQWFPSVNHVVYILVLCANS